MKEYIQIFTTTGRRQDAERIAQVLVQKRLAGCVQLIANVASTYWWKGKIEKTEEWLCLIKSEKTLYEQVEKVIKEIHPYEIPEITAVPIVTGSKEYFRWLDQELRQSEMHLS
jgi:periplasmic divalent cation tolerance protein